MIKRNNKKKILNLIETHKIHLGKLIRIEERDIKRKTRKKALYQTSQFNQSDQFSLSNIEYY